ncbi:MAG: hypothetical protein HRU09_17345 [Oligoflexales bacterium]|nr:hypothetical protein [Oligoflexales bacterium]
MGSTSLEYSDSDAKKQLISQVQLFLHYSLNACFVPEGYILDKVSLIEHIPCRLAHGRFDLNTAPFSAFDLKKAYGDLLKLDWVNSGHLRSDPPMQAKLQELAINFLA